MNRTGAEQNGNDENWNGAPESEGVVHEINMRTRDGDITVSEKLMFEIWRGGR